MVTSRYRSATGIFNRNDESERIPYGKHVRIIIIWSEWRDLNSRPLAPSYEAPLNYLELSTTWNYLEISVDLSENIIYNATII